MSLEKKLLDVDPLETEEWLSALESVIEHEGIDRAGFLLKRLQQSALSQGLSTASFSTPYINTIPYQQQSEYPGDIDIERKIRSWIRWNALAMVMRANQDDADLGGHISSFASAATLYDVGFNHFFHAATDQHGGDLVFYQGHSSPGMYARAFVEKRLTVDQMDNFRREVDGGGLSSYPHPWLMKGFWQFPTVSMGLGPLQAIYQAHFMKYLHNRELIDASNRKIWAFLGDGEMDEPESLGAITVAGREKLDNLIFVVNCNLQRLDGPVRGNGKIIQELESLFLGAGWNVIKVVWGSGWDSLLDQDTDGLLKHRMMEAVDGEYQACKMHGGKYTREHFFNKYPGLEAMVAHMSDEDISRLDRGGHDSAKVFAAYKQACEGNGKPTIILAKTVKGYGTGNAEAQNKTHNLKKLDSESVKIFRDRFQVPFTDAELEKLPYYIPDSDSPEMKYLLDRRKSLGGFMPQRKVTQEQLTIPDLSIFDSVLKGSGERSISTTMGFVRMLSALAKDKSIGKRVVPIVPDEARTFGMEGMFRQLGIYAPMGQLYTPGDMGQMMYYREDVKGQILEEGINEGGAFSSWLAAATSYSIHNITTIPFYIYYSMFGFQRIGDLAWAAGDSRARGFLVGATAGRTTLNGEGLQHQDGHSHLLAGTIPNCIAYDPAFNFELAVIIHDGLKRMVEKQEDVFYYITTMNENYTHPALPEGAEEGIIKGMYRLLPFAGAGAVDKNGAVTSAKKISDKSSKASQKPTGLKVKLLGSGTILNEVIAAKALLMDDFKVDAEVWSVTSFNELRKNGMAVERWNRLNPEASPKSCTVADALNTDDTPVIASTDYMKLVSDQVRPYIKASFTALGTDGFGRSDARSQLRKHFEVDRYNVVVASLKALVDKGELKASVVTEAIKRYGLDPNKPNPIEV